MIKSFLVTGAAGFIGSQVSALLLKKGHRVTGVDLLNDYYDVRLKRYRLRQLASFRNFDFQKADIEKKPAMEKLFQRNRFGAVLNLAARAGVPASMKNPWIYVSTNMTGTLNLLECCRRYGARKFVLASTSSIYSGQPMPFSEEAPANRPISPYAASKKGAEAMAHVYHYLYGIDATVVRYFTVYGPAGRPDMSIFRFVKWIDEGKPVAVFGDGTQKRDFTYVDDIAKGTVGALSLKGYQILNLGGDHPYRIMDAIRMIEKHLGKKAQIKNLPFQKVDARATWADIRRAGRLLGWKPRIRLEEGIRRTVDWYRCNKTFVKTLKDS